jgi:hypothetical protein
MNAVGSPNIGELGSWSQKPRSPRPIGRDRRQAAPTIRRGDIRRYERTQPLQRHHLAPRLRGLRPDGRARDSYYWPCRYLRSRIAGPDQDRIYYRFLVGTAERDRRPCPEGTGFARGRGISELDRRSRKSVALDAEPRVRILLPPAASQVRTIRSRREHCSGVCPARSPHARQAQDRPACASSGIRRS